MDVAWLRMDAIESWATQLMAELSPRHVVDAGVGDVLLRLSCVLSRKLASSQEADGRRRAPSSGGAGAHPAAVRLAGR
jgi:hypothetical protein